MRQFPFLGKRRRLRREVGTNIDVLKLKSLVNFAEEMSAGRDRVMMDLTSGRYSR